MNNRLAQIQNLTLAQLLEETNNEEITAITGGVLTITSQHDPDDWWTCSLGDLLTFLATATKEGENDGEHISIIEEAVKLITPMGLAAQARHATMIRASMASDGT